MRRIVVTPTFAAGLGVVVAAMLAYPMQTVFNYAAPNGIPCPQTTTCGGVSTQDGGEPASVPGNRLSTPGPSASHTASKRSGSAARTGRPGGRGHSEAALPELSYQTSGKWHRGFDGTIVIRFRPRSGRGNWWLRFGYPSAHILKVWAAGRYLSHGPQIAAVGSWDWPSQASSGRLLQISIGVAGRPGPPRWCLFNGRPCHISQRRGGPPGHPGGGKGGGGGGSGGHGGGSAGHGGGSGGHGGGSGGHGGGSGGHGGTAGHGGGSASDDSAR